ncbi:helix-turn-helix domain-containing protein [Microbispora sp. CA-102843]|uniref:helix-turn-helix domain-containing protein n=1 Tax=Microbispora sp. CA-102843 TaxID=3239952 RepID=UPI003D8B4482
MADRDDYDWAALGRAICARRIELGIPSQTAAAERAGININSWNKAETGKPVGGRILQTIAHVLGWEPGTPHEILTHAYRRDVPPLAVIPLPTGLDMGAAILRALADAWQRERGQSLVAGDMATEPTPWGPAIVIRAPHDATTEETNRHA